jgi:predicted amidohydrolase
MKSPLTVAALQMATSADVEQNAQKVHGAIDRAADAQAELLVVPECALSGYLPERDLNFDALQAAQDALVAHAAKRQLWLALGTTRRRDDAWFNSALLFSPDGRLAAAYDKTQLTEGDRAIFKAGDELPVFRVGEWTVALQVCFDMRFPENWRILRRQGAELILHMSSASAGAGWKVPVLEGTVRCRAAENGMFVVSANDARVPQMLVSAICDPDGKHLASAEENVEMMITATLDRKAVKSDFLAERRTDIWRRPEFQRLLLE